MSYIGKTPTVGNFQVCDAISVVNNQAAYTMQVGSVNVSPESANHMIVSLNGVIQKPTDAFTVSGSTITFASNLVTGDVINFIQILGNVLDLGVPSDNTVTNSKIANSSVTYAKTDGNFGQVLQFVSVQSGAVATGTTLFPEDDTIPQSNEGNEYMTLAITPKSATSKMYITGQVFGSFGGSTRWGIALFKDSVANAASFTAVFTKDATSMDNGMIDYSEVSANTTERTYKIRAGGMGSAGTFTFNGQGGNRKFGGTILSTIHIIEIQV